MGESKGGSKDKQDTCNVWVSAVQSLIKKGTKGTSGRDLSQGKAARMDWGLDSREKKEASTSS